MKNKRLKARVLMHKPRKVVKKDNVDVLLKEARAFDDQQHSFIHEDMQQLLGGNAIPQF